MQINYKFLIGKYIIINNRNKMKRIINNKGLLNSFNDQPSLIDDEGNKYWHKDGRFRRDNNLPYVEMSQW
jgi:hypothetical protein